MQALVLFTLDDLVYEYDKGDIDSDDIQFIIIDI